MENIEIANTSVLGLKYIVKTKFQRPIAIILYLPGSNKQHLPPPPPLNVTKWALKTIPHPSLGGCLRSACPASYFCVDYPDISAATVTVKHATHA